jgi:hypothetical protein
MPPVRRPGRGGRRGRRGPAGGGQAPVGRLDGDAGAAHQYVVEAEGALVRGGVDGLGGQVVLGPGQRLGQLGPPGGQGQDLVDGAPCRRSNRTTWATVSPVSAAVRARRFQAAR